MSELKPFRFRITRKIGVCDESDRITTITLYLQQAVFEDYQTLRGLVREAIKANGIDLAEQPYWREDPEVEDGLVEKLREAIPCHPEAQFSARYFHSGHQLHYKDVLVDGNPFKYMMFQGDRLVKFAPAN